MVKTTRIVYITKAVLLSQVFYGTVSNILYAFRPHTLCKCLYPFLDHIDIDVDGLLLAKLNDPSFCEELSSALRDVANLESSIWKDTRIPV